MASEGRRRMRPGVGAAGVARGTCASPSSVRPLILRHTALPRRTNDQRLQRAPCRASGSSPQPASVGPCHPVAGVADAV